MFQITSLQINSVLLFFPQTMEQDPPDLEVPVVRALVHPWLCQSQQTVKSQGFLLQSYLRKSITPRDALSCLFCLSVNAFSSLWVPLAELFQTRISAFVRGKNAAALTPPWDTCGWRWYVLSYHLRHGQIELDYTPLVSYSCASPLVSTEAGTCKVSLCLGIYIL